MKKKVLLVVIILIILLILGFLYFNRDNNKTNDLVKKIEKTDKYKKYNEIEDSIFGEYYHKAYDYVEKLSIEEKIGQLFLVRYDKNMTNDWSKLYPGGYILFAKDFDGHNTRSISEELKSITSKVPLTFAVDEEGGFVTRISRYSSFRSSKFLSPKYYYENGGYELLESTEKEKAKLLLDSSINLNLAPVADVSTNSNDFIYNRTFGYDANKTSELIKNMVKYANESGISSCLKHFPGYGNNQDTHTGSAFDNRNYENFVNNDYLPFIAGIEEEVPYILVSHNVINCIDSKLPASISLDVHKELREKLKFSGIIITDDLDMEAIKGVYDDAVVKAVNALNDVIITSDFQNDYNKVLEAYNNKEIKKETIDKAVIRIIAWKYKYKIM